MDKDKLISVFDVNAKSYDKYRPRYPSEVAKDLIELSQIKAKDKILEIGCGTGQITIDFLKKGYDVVAIEKGVALSKLASKNIEQYDRGQIINSTFEEWISQKKYKLVLSAQAFHWIDKKSGIDKILKFLRNEGSIGLIWTIDESQGTEFWKQTSKVYERYLPKKKGQKSMEETVNENWAYLNQRSEFVNFEKRDYLWSKHYSKETYLGLLRTFSPHMTLEKRKRAQFFQKIESIIEGLDNQLVRHYRTVLLFATKNV